MAGETSLFINDIHLDNSYQRKGLGKHLITLLELIARKEAMSRLSIPIQLNDEIATSWITKTKGFTIDYSFEDLGFDANSEVRDFSYLII